MPDLAAPESGARAAIVVPAAFAVAARVIERPPSSAAAVLRQDLAAACARAAEDVAATARQRFAATRSSTSVPAPPHVRDGQRRDRLLACVSDRARSREGASVHAALVLLGASRHLDDLWRLEAHLGSRAVGAR